mmetsp:Transcript_7366/g.15041  ORF Transcript_7366/g.15041 Transcript_7366/m.15041 type:complete len:180 (-) Transcript_7366:120-659(-)|eukprot:CAMPEP_0184682326 /NCGR_PEP_ID=MMETSP0312-20130426/6769_1 /TAXON_ID=31354 /ORGANISM="Compsopogon coeruleus, Strain SAG 36.94" /LENGTH=179 /DNA_ID=CAMNT_0027133917 /DNA_START=38 /DNA_END=577 /DNA_ORIENTATION=-
MVVKLLDEGDDGKFTPRYQLEPLDRIFVDKLFGEGKMFVITDPSLPDHPIVYASPEFCSFTQYDRVDIVNRNCRFLQGKATSDEDLEVIRDALRTGEDVTVGLINYKKNGEQFYNQFFMTTLRSPRWFFQKRGRIRYFVGIQLQSTEYEYRSFSGDYLKNYGKILRDKEKAEMEPSWGI